MIRNQSKEEFYRVKNSYSIDTREQFIEAIICCKKVNFNIILKLDDKPTKDEVAL